MSLCLALNNYEKIALIDDSTGDVIGYVQWDKNPKGRRRLNFVFPKGVRVLRESIITNNHQLNQLHQLESDDALGK